jgi:hypothetical protein
LAQLQRIASDDRAFVTRWLADRWVPQLSSKRLGLVAEGTIWNNAKILSEHLQLRAQFPEARLLWAGDWSTFDAPDFWVTIAGDTFPDAVGALAWCTRETSIETTVTPSSSAPRTQSTAAPPSTSNHQTKHEPLGIAFASDPVREFDEVVGVQIRPSMRHPTPLGWDRRFPVGSTEQSARDRRHGVGVPTASYRGVEGQAEMVNAENALGRIVLRGRRGRDGRLCTLQRFHHPPVVPEVRRLRLLCNNQPFGPQVSAIGVDVLQADSSIQHAGEDRMADRATPQHASITGLKVVMG